MVKLLLPLAYPLPLSADKFGNFSTEYWGSLQLQNQLDCANWHLLEQTANGNRQFLMVKTNLASSREELIYVDFASSLAIPGMLILLQKVALLSEAPQERLLEIVVAPDRSHDPLRASNIPTADPTTELSTEQKPWNGPSRSWATQWFVKHPGFTVWSWFQVCPGTEVVVLQIPLPVKLNVLGLAEAATRRSGSLKILFWGFFSCANRWTAYILKYSQVVNMP